MNASEQIQAARQKLAILEKLEQQFPDLKIINDGWNNEYYVSASVNSKATHFRIVHTCGCCTDAGTLAEPYIIVEGTRIYSYPQEFRIGELDGTYHLDVAYYGWQEEMRKHNIPEAIIKQIEAHLADHEQRLKESREEDEA